MKSTLLIALLLLVLLACDKDDVDLIGSVGKEQWFKDLQQPCDKNSVCKTSIHKAIYEEYTVYFTDLYGGHCDPSFYRRLYNEKGEVVKEYDETNVFDFDKEVTSVTTIWTCD